MSPQLAEAAAPQIQYQRRLARIRRDLTRSEDAAVRDLFRFLTTLRAQTVADLATVPLDGGTWPAHRLTTLLTEIDQATAALRTRLDATLRDATRQAWAQGAEASLTALDGLVSVRPAALSIDQLMVAQSLHADLVRNVSGAFRTRAAREVTMVIAGAQTPQTAMQRVGGLLRTQPGRQGLGAITAQAERIVRTETMTAFNLADRLRDEQLADDVPGLHKYWDAHQDARTRASHAAADRRYRPGGSEGPIALRQDFVVGGEKAQGPHDPRLSAANRVNCRCVRALWSTDW